MVAYATYIIILSLTHTPPVTAYVIDERSLTIPYMFMKTQVGF